MELDLANKFGVAPNGRHNLFKCSMCDIFCIVPNMLPSQYLSDYPLSFLLQLLLRVRGLQVLPVLPLPLVLPPLLPPLQLVLLAPMLLPTVGMYTLNYIPILPVYKY